MELFKLFGTIGIKNEEANQAIDETTEKAEGSEGRMSSAFKKIGTAIAAAFAIDKIIAFGKEIVNVAADVDAEFSAFEQIMGDYTDEAKAKVSEIADATGMVDTRLTPYMTSMTAKFKGLGFGIEESTDLASEGLTIAADAAAFWDKSLDESMSHLNSFVNGSYEGGEAIGLFANDTQMAAYAVKTGVVDSTKAWSSLDEATKQATRLDYAKNMMQQSGATGQAAKEAGQYANVQANLNEKWRQFKARIGEPILENIVIPAMEALSEAVDTLSVGFQKLSTFVDEHKTALTTLGAIVLGLATFFGILTAAQNASKVATLALSVATKVQAAAQALLNMVMMANPIVLIVAAIAALVVAFVVLWNKSEGFRNFWIGLWNKITSTVETVKNKVRTIFENIRATIQQKFDAIKTKVSTVVSAIKTHLSFSGLIGKVQSTFNKIKAKITAPIESAKTKISGIINKIKGFFPLHIGKIFSGMKLPHFTVSGKFPYGIGGKGEKPSFSVKWYAKAVDNPYLFSSPTVFGAGLDGIKVAGETDPEIMYGKSNLMRDIRNATAETATNNDRVEALLSTIAEWISSPTGFKRTMIDILTNDVKFMLDDRQVAKVVKAYVG